MKRSAVFLFFALLTVFASPAGARRLALVDINRASAGYISSLPGVSDELAERIVESRERSGYYERISDLLRVEGMTEEIFSGISPYLIMTPPGALRAAEIIEELEVMEEEEEEYFLDLDVEISRLEAYRSSPLDLNTAVYSQLLELPGIDQELAAAIIALRRQLRGFESVNDIRNLLGPYRFDRVRPFVAVLDEADLARIHGDIRVSAEVQYPYHPYYFDLEPEYQYPLQIEARQRLRYGNRLEFGFNMRRKASAHWPPSYDGARKIDYASFNDYFLGARYLMMRSLGAIDTLILGSYRLDYFRPATRTRRMRGLRIDERATVNSGFYGAAAEMRPGDWELTAFVSEKEFAVGAVNEYDGSAAGTLRSLYYTGNYPIFEPPYLSEKIYGGIIRRDMSGGLTLGAGGYIKKFSRVIDHESGFPNFRGDEINIIDLEAEYIYRNMRFIADWGLCRYRTFDPVYDSGGVRVWAGGRDWYWDTGNALRLTLVSDHSRARFWAYYWLVDHDYYDLLGEGYDSTYNGRNEVRYSIGGRIDPKRGMSTQADLIYQELIERIYRASANSRFTVKVRQSLDLTDKFLLRYTGTFRSSDEWRTAAVRYSDLKEVTHRLEVTHRASDRIRLRCVFRTKRGVFDEIAYMPEDDTDYGNYAELRYRPTDPLVVVSRAYVQDSGHGVGWRVRPVFTFSRHSKLSMEYEQDPRADGASRNKFSVQYDMSW